jgi:hypothetical protein
VTTAGASNADPPRAARPRTPAASAIRLAAVVFALAAGAAADARAGEPAPPAEAPPALDQRPRGAAGAGFIGMLLDLGLPREAAVEARRVALRFGGDAVPPETMFRIGMALALAGDADQAAAMLNQAATVTDDPARADRWQLAAGVALLRARAFPHATHIFARVEAFGADAVTRERAVRLRCIGAVLARDGAAARTCIAGLPATPARAAEQPAEIDSLLRQLDVDPGRRAVMGGLLSGFVPGLGQATAGQPGDAALALLVNGAWGTAVYFLIADGAFLDAGLLGAGVGLRYYLGNIHHGAEAWRAAADRRRSDAADRLMRLLGADAPR